MLEEQLSQLSFQGATGWLNFSHSASAAQTSVKILQIQNGQPVQIGLYYHSLNQVFLNVNVLGEIPSDTQSHLCCIPNRTDSTPDVINCALLYFNNGFDVPLHLLSQRTSCKGNKL